MKKKLEHQQSKAIHSRRSTSGNQHIYNPPSYTAKPFTYNTHNNLHSSEVTKPNQPNQTGNPNATHNTKKTICKQYNETI
jgi:hypothetical protein